MKEWRYFMKGKVNDYLYIEKKARRFTLDLENWFAEGQTISVKFNKDDESLSILEAQIVSINDNGHIIMKQSHKTFEISYNDIIGIRMIDRRNDNMQNTVYLTLPNFFIFNDIYAFSLNGKDWYYEGQYVDIVTDKEFYTDVKICSVHSDDISNGKTICVKVADSLIYIPVCSIEDMSFKDRRIQIA